MLAAENHLLDLLIETLQSDGIAASGKHFPGHGDTSTDSHYELPIVDQSPERLREVVESHHPLAKKS